MKHPKSTFIITTIASGLLLATVPGMAQTTVFSDNFASSTLNSLFPGAPTANSTGYQIVATEPLVSSSVAAGHLGLDLGTVSGNGYQVQALFAGSPVTLATVGDYVQLSVTFTDAGGFLTTANGTLVSGMYNSGGVAPISGGVNDEHNTSTDFATGGAMGWQGYVGQISTNHTYLITRAAQTGTGNNNQDLAFGYGAGPINSSSKGYANPPATSLGTGNGNLLLSANGQYTMSLTYELTDVNTLTITSSLYSGADTSGTLLSTYDNTASGANFLTDSFDGLAFGFYANKSQATAMDINQISVSDYIQSVPEPSTLALVGMGLVGMAARWRGCRRSKTVS